MKIIFLVGVGGASGSILRYLVYIFTTKYLNFVYPLQTLFVNILGCLLMGIFVELFNSKLSISNELKYFLLLGILGGFTTFSAFSADFFNIINRGGYLEAFGYIFISVSLSLLAFFLGAYITKVLL